MTETVTQLYDDISEATQEISEVIEQLDAEDGDISQKEVVEARENLKKIKSRLSGSAMNAYNGTQYASEITRKEHKGSQQRRKK